VSLRFAAVLQTPKDQQSAVYNVYRELGDYLASTGCSLDILTPDDLDLPPHYGRLVPLVYPTTVRRWMLSHLDAYDLVLFHSYAGWRALGSLAAAGKPGVVAFHGLEPLYHQELKRGGKGIGRLSARYRFLQERLMPFFLRRSCRAATRIFCSNTRERDWLKSWGHARSEQIALLTHGVPAPYFSAPRPARPLRNLLFVGQWLPMKGVLYLADAAAELMRDDPDLTLTCAGTLASSETVLAAFEPRCHDRVRVVPRLDTPALARLYAEADVFVFPSLYEGFGRAIAEAMASGLPIVTTPVGVALDALRDGESCLVVPLRDAGAIAYAVRRLASDTSLRSSIAAGAHAAAGRYKSIDRTREFADALFALADRPSRRYSYGNT
jgi:glycosyltransferase involved in cell wall biosynthesis